MASKELGSNRVDDIERVNSIPETVMAPKAVGPVPPMAKGTLRDAMDDIPGPETATKRSQFRTFTIVTALFLSMFVAALDQTIIATAIPTITASLESASGYTW